ncbi:hypothetical protein I316_01507 [Kwoniella heveanensis BCC8398]|uniref:Extracellular membrane protein CFEM domain-containing protein n=1 Tax=Kwoniella heveanensis BCC8398 TaxID=1296120 RepID=A0A1B9H0W5_9TREE|nr:hypothetical protein I316_01507 [Kwoniella heveanensis BCC8398]
MTLILQALALLLVLPLASAAPAPDTIFLLQRSTFTPLGCSRSFHPTSILRQVPTPFACFSRCSDREIAAYSQLQSGVLCACGTEEMIQGIGEMERCRDDTWFLFSNEELEKTKTASDAEAQAQAEETEAALKIQTKKDRLMPFRMMRKKANAKRDAEPGQVI